MARWLLQILIISSLHLSSVSSQQETSFVYESFLDRQNLYLDKSAIVLPSGLLQLTNASEHQMGHAFHKKPIEFSSSGPLSFSTHFVCALVPKPGFEGGHGIVFVLSPSMDFTHAESTRYLGIFNASTNGSSSYHVLAVELDTIWNPDFKDIDHNHVGIDVNSPISVAIASASYYSDMKGSNESINLLSGNPIQVWVDYEGTLLNVSVAPLEVQKPTRPLLSHPINLTELFPNRSSLFAGFSAATGTAISDQYILWWSFSIDRGSLQRLDISKLPEVPHPRAPHKKVSTLIILLPVCLAILVLAVLAGLYFRRRRKPTMEQVVLYLNKNLPLPDFSPYTLGIGTFAPVLVDASSLVVSSASWSLSGPSMSSSSPNHSPYAWQSTDQPWGQTIDTKNSLHIVAEPEKPSPAVKMVTLPAEDPQSNHSSISSQSQENLYLDGSATVLPNGLLQLTNASDHQMAHVFYKDSIELSSSKPLSFSTHFVCALVPQPGVEGGHGMAFVVSPSMDFSHAESTRYLGIFNVSKNGSPSSNVLAVELDTIWNPDFEDIDHNHVGIDVNSPLSVGTASASYYSDIKGKNESINLLSGHPIQVWVDYEDNMLNVSMAPREVQKPSRPLLSQHINLSDIYPNRRLFVGFSAATGTAISYQYVLSWSFSTSRGSLQRFDISRLPEVPHPRAEHKNLSPLFIDLLGFLAIMGLCTLTGMYFFKRGKPTMEQVILYLNQNLPLPDFSPYTVGISNHSSVLIDAASLVASRSCQQEEAGFIYNGFGQAQAGLHLDGAAKILFPDGLLQLTNASTQQMGHAFFKKPFKFDSYEKKLSFSTHFVCALVPKPGADGGHGIAFVVSSSIDFTQADPTQYLGLLNISTNGSPSSQLLAIELDTVESAEFDDIDKNHVGIDIKSLNSVESASASYFSNAKGKNQSIKLLSGDPIQIWVDYEGALLNVTVAPLSIQKPNHPLLSRSINLTDIFPDRKLFFGFSAATGTLVSYQYILGWSFSRSRMLLQSLDFSKLPQIPHPKAKQEQTSPLLIVLLMDSIVDAIDTRLGGQYSVEETVMVLKLGLICTNIVAESRPTMEQVIQYINQNLPLPNFSPGSLGIGVSTPVLLESVFNSRSSLAPSISPPSSHNSMFVTHTITYGDGR
ncbi:unnamed protein product [Arabidopsis thaliana]|uniref:(thale cress) hypothetical protein n=1 Tax=Arabidopsis thaliana TaxID=3702 RepID=A0A7G2FHM4_ARATH|nr:unnamed protein product [Arabidopsis thaliana]